MLPRRRCPASSLLLPSVGGPTRSSAGTSPLAALCKDPAQLSRDAAVMASNATAISRASRAGQTGSQRRGPAVLTPTSGRPPTATIALYATCIVSGATPASTKSPLSTIPATWGRAYDGGCPPHNWLWDDIRQIDRGGGPQPMPAARGRAPQPIAGGSVSLGLFVGWFLQLPATMVRISVLADALVSGPHSMLRGWAVGRLSGPRVSAVYCASDPRVAGAPLGAENHLQCREAGQEAGSDPARLQGGHQVPAADAEAW